jgi:peptide/nickel transport system substrate-binding protein
MRPARLLAWNILPIVVFAACALSATTAPPSTQRGAAGTQRLTVAVSRDTGPLNIYRGDGAFDYLVDLVYDKLFAPSPYVSEPQPWPAERSATPGVHPKHHPGTAAASPPPINEPGPSKTSRA